MILYKYVSADVGLDIIESGFVRFSDSRSFNDPFDTPTYPPERELEGFELLTAGVRRQIKESIWANNTGVLSLTRTPSNSLMWAHYAQQHAGLVLGFDTKVAGFTHSKANVIPAQYGSVVYVSARPTHDFVSEFEAGLAVGDTYEFAANHYEKLQRIFLMKALYWAYEEEVRVLKCIKVEEPGTHSTPAGTIRVIGEPDQLRLYQLPASSIVEVYFGARFGLYEATDVFERTKRKHTGVSFFECALDKSALCVRIEDYSPEYP